MLSRADWRGEWLAVRRHPLVWIAALLSCAMVAVAAANEAPRDARTLQEALLRLNFLIPAFLLPFTAGALAPVFFLREVDHRLSPLFAAYPQSPQAWLTARFGALAAALLATALVQQALLIALLNAQLPGHALPLIAQAARLFALVQLPACLIWAAVLARLASASGRTRLVHLAAAFGWLLYIGLATLSATPLIAGSFVAWPPLRSAMLLADPYAITALASPPAELRVDLGHIVILLNRLGWLGLAAYLLRTAARIPALNAVPENALPRAWPGTAGWRQGKARAGLLALLLRWTLLDTFFLLALAGWALLVFPEVYAGMHYAEQLAVLTPDSRDALNRVMWDLVPPMGALMLLYAADRAGRMASAHRLAELAAAAPYAPWRTIGAQIACLWLVALVLLAFTLLVVLAGQIAAQSPIQPGEYLVQGGQVLPGLLLAATAFAALHAAVRMRMAANLIGMALIVLGHSSLAPAIGLGHPLWQPLSLPLTVPDQIIGPSANWAAMAPFALLWAAICSAAVLVAVRLHHRGLPYPQTRLRLALAHPMIALAGLLLAGAAWQGRAIDRALQADFALTSAQERAAGRAAYERRYASWQDLPQPDIAEVRSVMDFAADGRSVTLDARLALINRSGQPIGRVLVGRNQIEVAGTLTLEGAQPEGEDRAAGQTVFRLSQPMQPGDVLTLHFHARIGRTPFASTRSLLILQPQFGALPLSQILPRIGFQREMTLRDPARRSDFGLPPLTITPPSQLGVGPARLARYQMRFDTVISLPKGRHALAPGDLVRRWDQAGRDHFHYRTDRPIHAAAMVFSLPWTPRRWPVGGLTVELYAPGDVSANDPSVTGVKDTLAWLDRSVAPYPGRSLAMVAAPEFGSSGYAPAQAMLISHRRSLRARPADGAGFNQAYRRAVHETAHQWFGHVLGYGLPEERAFLVESLAKYAELVMIEQRYGRAAMKALVAWEAERLAHARLVPAEMAVPLIDAEDSEDMYSRATLAFACLRSRLGDAAILGALEEIARASAATGRPARARDFITALKRRAGPDQSLLIDRLLLDPVPIAQGLAQAGC